MALDLLLRLFGHLSTFCQFTTGRAAACQPQHSNAPGHLCSQQLAQSISSSCDGHHSWVLCDMKLVSGTMHLSHVSLFTCR